MGFSKCQPVGGADLPAWRATSIALVRIKAIKGTIRRFENSLITPTALKIGIQASLAATIKSRAKPSTCQDVRRRNSAPTLPTVFLNQSSVKEDIGKRPASPWTRTISHNSSMDETMKVARYAPLKPSPNR